MDSARLLGWRTNRTLVLVLAAAALIVAVACVAFVGGGPKEATERQRKAVVDAIAANDLAKVKELLPKQGETDFGEATYNDFLDVAAGKLTEGAGSASDDGQKNLKILAELSRHLRHVTGKTVVTAGKLEILLANAGVGSFVPSITLKSSDGAAYPLKISTEETEYKGASLDNQRFLVDFESTYKIRGVVVDNVLEAEEVELATNAHSGKGMVIPVGPLLPSTAEIFLSHTKDGRSFLVFDAAKNGNLRTIKALVKRNPGLVSIKDEQRGATPLFWAAFHGHKDVVEFLLASGADVNVKEAHGQTPLSATGSYKDVADVLRQHGGHE
ncbi:MAG TPA: ankyrin repeat domain-containing protein [Reyranella sp.]|nr:ankyrin repeat domain-containing protein [Reyranella sp.]